MATDPSLVGCPVCSEPLRRGIDRCFRCEADLTPWWPFEGKLLSLPAPGQPPTTEAPRPERSRPLFWTAAVLAAGVAGLALGLSLTRDRTAPPRPATAAVTSVEAPPPQARRDAPEPPARAHVPTPPSPTGRAPGPASDDEILTLVVREGDSLWRLAKTLTGRGESWRTLWPDRSEAHARGLVAGTRLTVRVPRVGPERRDHLQSVPPL